MKERDSEVGVEARQRLLEPIGQHFRVAHERLHLGFAEVAAVGAPKAAAESLGPGDADPRSVDVERGGITFEYRDARLLEDALDLLHTVGLVSMVAEPGEHREPTA